ncbi:ADP-ribosylglycohydrolase family protein [Brachybacterium halotolerans subsp. kimchii]|uniref:ADP-ribosylglycohydrolase family protein n=1 Tax=Brachybacterium halotolerans TaxID=2795215 RepID=UPI001E628747|nr:ADP-ribosylglycohydrolase family protein [Brachybacterium halotolerans]UEJ81547.1 ADP-ribosylglycohydrolase family protein [Brachybacterium halotolerans subsp. kimchii]
MSAAGHPTTVLDRAHGALLGLAIGDALGMPTQSLSREQISDRYGRIDGFVAGAPDQPIAPGMPAGSITDDTEQALILARLAIDGGGRVDEHDFAEALISWEQDMIARGSLDLLGPSTRAALAKLQAGVPVEETGRYGTTNGAAMRIAPVGIAHAPGEGLMDAVVQASRVTHNTGLGISGAAAIAAAVSAGVDGADVDQALEAARTAAADGATRGNWIAGGSIAQRFGAFRGPVRGMGREVADDFLYEVVGTSVQSQESVVSALLLVERGDEDPFGALCAAASLGGDTDTVAAMAGAVLGAVHGADAFPASAVQNVQQVNDLDLMLLARRLLALRS